MKQHEIDLLVKDILQNMKEKGEGKRLKTVDPIPLLDMSSKCKKTCNYGKTAIAYLKKGMFLGMKQRPLQ